MPLMRRFTIIRLAAVVTTPISDNRRLPGLRTRAARNETLKS
jgi:hypothetical protein